MSVEPRKRYRIGYALAPKKVETVIQPSLLDHANLHNIDLVHIDSSKPLTKQAPFDAILHKLYGPDWATQLLQFSAQNPTVPVIEPLPSVQKLHSRVSMLQPVHNLHLLHPQTLDVPRQVVVSDMEEASKAKLGFPLIAKPVMVDGSDTSHKLYLVFDDGGLEETVKDVAPVLLQEFVNHGGVLFKVYVVGDHVQCVRRNSLPDITQEKLSGLKGAVSFSQISSLRLEEEEERKSEVVAEMPEQGFVEEVARGLRREMGLRLFNFDMIRDAKVGNRYLIIDINYFPGYAKMPNYEPVFINFLLDVVGRSKQSHDNGNVPEAADHDQENQNK